MARVSAHRLEELVREAEVLSTIKADVPNAWKILELEIGRARAAVVRSVEHSASTSLHVDPASSSLHEHHIPRQSIRKRVKLRVPAEQYPDYNFVGRLLGPRGATLKRLERDTGCRIMIRGKGSIRKDKEAEVRGKPGWEHVFHEPLHVVIEVVDAPDESVANRTLARAKELVDMLLVPVPEERDSLKRAQLRDLAILNGTHRSVSDLLGASVQNMTLNPSRSPPPPMASSPPPIRRTHSHHAKPTPKMYPTDYASAFDSSASFARQNSYSPSTARRHVPNVNPYPTSTGFASAPQDSILPDLEKLRIPALDFDHLNESNMATSAFPMPSASPTVVDPEIYPYPPTPGFLNVDQQISAFGSPMWTPSRPNASAISSNSLPPRSPPAVDSSAAASSSFLLGRALGDPQRHQHQHQHQHQHSAFGRDGQRDTLSFEQSFAAQYTDGDIHRDFDGNQPKSHQQQAHQQPPQQQQQNPFASMKNSNGDSIVLANLFPTSGPSAKSAQPLDPGRNGDTKQQTPLRLEQQQHPHVSQAQTQHPAQPQQGQQQQDQLEKPQA